MELDVVQVRWLPILKVIRLRLRKDLGQYTSPRGKGGHSKGDCAIPRFSAASQINSQCHSLGADLGANPYSAIFLLCGLEYSP